MPSKGKGVIIHANLADAQSFQPISFGSVLVAQAFIPNFCDMNTFSVNCNFKFVHGNSLKMHVSKNYI